MMQTSSPLSVVFDRLIFQKMNSKLLHAECSKYHPLINAVVFSRKKVPILMTNSAEMVEILVPLERDELIIETPSYWWFQSMTL